MGKSSNIHHDSRVNGNIDARIECSGITTYNNDGDKEGHNRNCTQCSDKLSRDTPFINVRGSCQPYVLRKNFSIGDRRNNMPSYEDIRLLGKTSYANAGDREVGSYGYHDGERLECCVGIKNDNTSCAPCWCPQSTDPKMPCINALNRYCSEKNGSGKFKIFDDNDQICKRYKEQRSGSAGLLKNDLCNKDDSKNNNRPLTELSDIYSDSSKSGCLEHCKIAGSSCDVNITRFCSLLTQEQASKESVCSCFMPISFYTKLKLDLKDLLNLNIPSNIKPLCLYPKCSTADIKPKDAIACQTKVICSRNIDITDLGVNVIGIDKELIKTNTCSYNTIGAGGVITPIPNIVPPQEDKTDPDTGEATNPETDEATKTTQKNKLIAYGIIGVGCLIVLIIIIKIVF
jgi:hypothetical protein